ncbi:MAG: hypothetical protein AABX03_04745 [Nanoarchaeota archaeon]
MNFDTDNLIQVTEALVKISQKAPSNNRQEKEGGFLTLVLGDFKKMRIFEIGNYDHSKRDKYASFSQEKAHRVYSDWLRNKTAVSSWQTRQPEIDRYGGAVLFGYDYFKRGVSVPLHDIVSFSGLSEASDEAVSAMLGYGFLPQVDDEALKKIANVSKNDVLKEMFLMINKSPLIV